MTLSSQPMFVNDSRQRKSVWNLSKIVLHCFLRAFFEHIVGFVVDVLPHSRSVSSSMGRILLDEIIGD